MIISTHEGSSGFEQSHGDGAGGIHQCGGPEPVMLSRQAARRRTEAPQPWLTVLVFTMAVTMGSLGVNSAADREEVLSLPSLPPLTLGPTTGSPTGVPPSSPEVEAGGDDDNLDGDEGQGHSAVLHSPGGSDEEACDGAAQVSGELRGEKQALVHQGQRRGQARRRPALPVCAHHVATTRMLWCVWT